MGESEREKMASGQWYSCLDPELDRLRIAARTAVHRHNTLPPGERGAAAPDLIRLLAGFGAGAFIEAPFHCAYGFNLSLGEAVYLNAGCVILDTARVTIGDRSMLGPRCRSTAPSITRTAACVPRGWRSPGRSRSAPMSGSAGQRSSWPA